MKFNFILKNNKESEMKINSLNQLLLSKNNLRYTLINDYENIELKNFLTDGTSIENQKKIFEDLFYNEGDLSDLKRLLDNIYSYGFDNSVESLYIIPTASNNYVVAEGNRRAMCLKILNNDFQIPPLSLYLKKNNFYADENDEKIEDLDDNEYNESKIEKNYKEIEKIIKEIKKEKKDAKYDIYCEIIKDSNYLWRTIYDKHLTGERPGMRKWSRGKYFADLLSIFPKGLMEDLSKNFLKNINREKDFIVRDFKEAEFIYLCFYYGKELYITENDKKVIWNKTFDNLDILNDILTSDRISALERVHSINKVKKIFCEEILNVKDNKFSIFDDEYFSISYSEKDNLIQFNEKKITKEDFLKFIYYKWKKKVITTRPIKKADMDDFIDDLKFLVDNIDINIDYNEKIPLSKLEKINAFSISKTKRESIIKYQIAFHKKEDIIRFEIAEKIINNNEEIVEKMKKEILNSYKSNTYKDDNPISVFNILADQLDYNSRGNNKTFLNAIFCTIRSFFEQFLVWLKFLDFKKDDEKEKRDYIRKMAENRIDEIVRPIRDDFKRNHSTVGIFLSNSLKKGTNNKNYSSIVKDIINILKDETWNNIINENIHSSHRIYLKSTYINNLITYENFQKLVLTLLKEIDFNVFNELNKKLKEYISEIKPTAN